jgi:2-polyprenyl-3-methyl-5-hydroxy-6-metoxy-1,4-benzoquinol methylase
MPPSRWPDRPNLPARASPAHRRSLPEQLPVTQLTELLNRWRDDLSAWAIPAHITDGAAESPWVLPRQVFARRADRLRQAPAGPSFERAWEALEPAGSVLDVGSGAGAACLPLAPRITTLTAVDADEQMLGLLAARAGEAGLAPRLVHGHWPDAAAGLTPADVVTCHHVVFNVPGLGPFLAALTSHARRRVVVETAAVHPLTSLNPLWLRFHGLKRPERPTAGDTLAILAAMGLNPRHTEWSRPAAADYQSMAELVEVTRRRLCLPPERSGEVAAALTELGVGAGRPSDLGSSGRDVVTIWWEGTA